MAEQRIKFENILFIQFFSEIFGMQIFLQKYTVDLAHLLRENNAGVTSWTVSCGESARPHGLARLRRETARSRGTEERDRTISLMETATPSH